MKISQKLFRVEGGPSGKGARYSFSNATVKIKLKNYNFKVLQTLIGS